MPEVQSLILGCLINLLLIFVLQEIGTWIIVNILDWFLEKKGKSCLEKRVN